MKRMTIEFNEKTDETLKKWANKAGTSKVDILRKAVALYDYLSSEETEKKHNILIADEDNHVLTKLKFFPSIP